MNDLARVAGRGAWSMGPEPRSRMRVDPSEHNLDPFFARPQRESPQKGARRTRREEPK